MAVNDVILRGVLSARVPPCHWRCYYSLTHDIKVFLCRPFALQHAKVPWPFGRPNSLKPSLKKPISKRRRMNITLGTMDPGTSFPLNCLRFDNDSAISDVSRFEMSRLIKLLKKNPGTQVEIAVHREMRVSDSLHLADSATVIIDSLVKEPSLIAESSLQAVDSVQVPDEMLIEPEPDPTEMKAQAISKYLQERSQATCCV